MIKPTGRLLFAYNTISELNKRIAELEKRLSHAETMSGREQSIRNLEQQAACLDNFLNAANIMWADNIGTDVVEVDDLKLWRGALLATVTRIKNQE
jgi:hypothetical protein